MLAFCQRDVKVRGRVRGPFALTKDFQNIKVGCLFQISSVTACVIFHSLFTTWKVYLDPTLWPASSWLVSSVGRGHWFKSGMGLNFFSALISTTSSVVFIAARIAYISWWQVTAYFTIDSFWLCSWHSFPVTCPGNSACSSNGPGTYCQKFFNLNLNMLKISLSRMFPSV